MRIAVVGAGVAGTLLALRVSQASRRAVVDVYTGGPAGADATGASGGLVRGFERTPEAAEIAAAGLAELRGDPALRAAAGYREVGSVYLLPPGCDPTTSIRVLADRLPGSATVHGCGELSGRYPFRDLPAGTTAVVERHAGYFSPASLRTAVLAQLADRGVAIRDAPVTGLAAAPEVRLADGTVAGYDVVVVAAGAWTPALLAANGLRTDGLSTKQIQYTVFPAGLAGLGVFVDDTTGLYGRPADGGGFQVGLPCDRCDVDPARVATDTELVERVAAQAGGRLGLPSTGPRRTVASADCYHNPPGLALRPTEAAAIHTFTGGSGGAAKTVLAVSRTAATALLAMPPSAG